MTTDGASRRPSLAVVLPTLNEEAHLIDTLRSLEAQTEPAERVVVVDGGSHDRTAELATSRGAMVLVVSGRGRGGQISAGVAEVHEDVVVVAHGDMKFPAQALETIRDHLERQQDCPGGCLGHRFSASGWMLRVIEWFDRRRARRGMSYGDQCQFFRREPLLRIGGFPDQPIMEDVELSRRLRSLGRPAYLELPVTVSPRRFRERGVVRTVVENWVFRQVYRWRGPVACRSIFQRYYRPRQGPRVAPPSAP